MVNYGGPSALWDTAGRKTLQALLEIGLERDSKVLDFGCGALRCGRWVIQFLDSHCYYGIEPDIEALEYGKTRVMPSRQWGKRPQFSENDDWDFSVFGCRFDYILMRSIWTHAARSHIESTLDQLDGATLLTSFRDGEPYMGDEWKGRSHAGGKPEMVTHPYQWIERECAKRGLSIKRLPTFDFGGQEWLVIR